MNWPSFSIMLFALCPQTIVGSPHCAVSLRTALLTVPSVPHSWSHISTRTGGRTKRVEPTADCGLGLSIEFRVCGRHWPAVAHPRRWALGDRVGRRTRHTFHIARSGHRGSPSGVGPSSSTRSESNRRSIGIATGVSVASPNHQVQATAG